MKFNIEDFIIENHPHLKEKYESEQYKISRKFISFKVKNNLTQNEMAKIMKLNIMDYLRMETGNIDIEVDVYKKKLDELNSYKVYKSRNKKTHHTIEYSTNRNSQNTFYFFRSHNVICLDKYKKESEVKMTHNIKVQRNIFSEGEVDKYVSTSY